MPRLILSPDAAIALIDAAAEAHASRPADPRAESLYWESQAVTQRAYAEYARDDGAKRGYLTRAAGYESIAKQVATPLPGKAVISDVVAQERMQQRLSRALKMLDHAVARNEDERRAACRETAERADAEALLSTLVLDDAPDACRATSGGYVHARTTCGRTLTILSADGDTWITRIDGRELRYCTASGERLARDAWQRATA